MRSFVALAVPEGLIDGLLDLQEAVPVGRAVDEATLHLTLAFLGEVDAADLEELHLALEARRWPVPLLAVEGLVSFGGRAPKLLAADLARDPALLEIQRGVLSALRAVGLPQPRERFRPHITLVRFGSGLRAGDAPRLDRALAEIAGLRLPPCPADTMTLTASRLTPQGAIHEVLAAYPLG